MRSNFLFAAAALMVATPALGAVSVVGNSAARSCFLAAESRGAIAGDVLRFCDDALRREALSEDELVATLVNRGILKARLGDHDEAISDYDAALSRNPNEPEAYLNKGFALLQVSDTGQEAKPLFDSALAKKTRRPELAYYGRAVAHELSGQVRAAYSDYRQASQIDPKWRQPKLELARFKLN
ncbi:MAG TPA: tetratricopeptide repeat protein [Allosphingosinicella sp.]|nr:tetratricopeptide repeat protein [Allosphingosinicella sp.]